LVPFPAFVTLPTTPHEHVTSHHISIILTLLSWL
jgi:hypothetical protein